jgi:hypothetical protein
MASSGMLRRVALVRTDGSVELSASFIRATRIGELGTLAVTSNRRNDVSGERSASFIRVTRIGELGTLAVSSNRGTDVSESVNLFLSP